MSDDNEQIQQPTFAGYGRSFQGKVIQALITDHRWAAQMADVVKYEYFDLTELKFLAANYFGYYAKYKCFPSFEALITITRDALKDNSDDALKMRVITFLQSVRSNPDVGDLPWIKEHALDFCRKQEIRESLVRIVDKVEGSIYDEIVDELKRAVNKGACDSIGHDFVVDREARFVATRRRAVPTCLPELDAPEILNGGLGAGELGVIIAPTGVGKSHALVQFGAAAVMSGLKVNHYTFELSETAIGIRYDSHMTGISSSDIPGRREEVLRTEDNMQLGSLIIKGYPTKSASIQTLRAHIERSILQGHKPDILMIDYADIMRSTRHYEAPRFELAAIYEELRNLAMDIDIPIWTASQSNRESANSEIVGLANMSESYGKAFVADVVISLSRKPSEKATGLGRLFVAKNRAGRDGIVYPMKIDTATSTIVILDVSSSLDEAHADDERTLKNVMRDKMRELHG